MKIFVDVPSQAAGEFYSLKGWAIKCWKRKELFKDKNSICHSGYSDIWLPVADKQAQASWPGLPDEDGGHDRGEHNHWPDQVQTQSQPPGPALQHQRGPRVRVDLKKKVCVIEKVCDIVKLFPPISNSSKKKKVCFEVPTMNKVFWSSDTLV